LVLGTDTCVPHVHGYPPELVTVQFTRLGGIKRTLFFRTSMLYRVQAGLWDREVVPRACDETVVFLHGDDRRLGIGRSRSSPSPVYRANVP
jgi:hypothetical protein